MATASPPASTAPSIKVLWVRLALFAATVGVVGSLYLSLGMALKACPLCFYQRAFIMAAAAILAFGLFLPDVPSAVLSPLALGPATAGACVAAWHSYLDWKGTLECPPGVTGVLPVPQESLIVYAILLALLLIDLFHQRRYVVQGLGALLLGFVFAATSIQATPPAPTQPAPAPLDGCRKAAKG